MKVRDVDADPVTRLVESLRKIPGIGPKKARRMAMHILRSGGRFADELAERIRDVGRRTTFCSRCRNISTSDPCGICSNPRRDSKVVCVVEEPADIAAIEKTAAYNGVYHVLHGALNPMDGTGPEDIKLESFIERVKKEGIREVIIATNTNSEGENTAHYLAKQLKSLKVKITRIARGVPMGGDIQYIDEMTLGEAISGRKEFAPEN